MRGCVAGRVKKSHPLPTSFADRSGGACGTCKVVQQLRAMGKLRALSARGVMLALTIVGAGCNPSARPGVTDKMHPWFTIEPGSTHEIGRVITEGKIDCGSCHPAAATFKQLMCVGCHTHEQSVTDRLHLTVGKYVAGKGDGCDSCHTGVEKNPYDHADIVGGCARCHDVGNAFAALPKDNFNHPPTAGADCSNCHQPRDWKDATPANAHDPSHDIMVTAQLPTYAGQSIVTLTSQDQT